MTRTLRTLSPNPPGRPTKFNAALGRDLVRLAGSEDHPTRIAVARGAGIGVQTLYDWLALGRAGREPLVAWAKAFLAAESEARSARRTESAARREARDRARWQAFRQAREGWWLERLGPIEFWRRRLEWLAAHGRWDAYQSTAAELEAQGFRILTRYKKRADVS
jgi:hypothetical protein